MPIGSSRFTHLTGKIFGRLTVLPFHFSIKDSDGKIIGMKWECVCICGSTKFVRADHLIRGKVKSCGCFRKERSTEVGKNSFKGNGISGFNKLKTRYRKGAEARGLKIELTNEDFKKLFQGNCFYCGQAPKQIISNSLPLKINVLNPEKGSYIHNGIDRLDSYKNYTLENCVSCCKDCNYAKKDMTAEQFKVWLTKVYTNFILKR